MKVAVVLVAVCLFVAVQGESVENFTTLVFLFLNSTQSYQGIKLVKLETFDGVCRGRFMDFDSEQSFAEIYRIFSKWQLDLKFYESLPGQMSEDEIMRRLQPCIDRYGDGTPNEVKMGEDRQALSEITLMQDGGPPHISRGAKQLLKDTFGEDRRERENMVLRATKRKYLYFTGLLTKMNEKKCSCPGSNGLLTTTGIFLPSPAQVSVETFPGTLYLKRQGSRRDVRWPEILGSGGWRYLAGVVETFRETGQGAAGQKS
ncbi:hypothetical protein LAZ67_11003237 [Cordylochernes scorpioides]|uniref:Uncharacterized protein n=1 Tax=Cordylochernes scorpioides TaxID=51811 RepID=A0ABY6KZP9_9ARAC|nr:hypothetical protein LAZ67_11003237 [Cordylochernes scorpioides]